MRLGRYEAAQDSLGRLVASYPSDPRALVPLGVLSFRQDRTHSALEVLSPAARAAPVVLGRAAKLRENSPRTLFERGRVHARPEELAGIHHYQSDPSTPRLYDADAAWLEGVGRSGKAESLRAEAARLRGLP